MRCVEDASNEAATRVKVPGEDIPVKPAAAAAVISHGVSLDEPAAYACRLLLRLAVCMCADTGVLAVLCQLASLVALEEMPLRVSAEYQQTHDAGFPCRFEAEHMADSTIEKNSAKGRYRQDPGA